MVKFHLNFLESVSFLFFCLIFLSCNSSHHEYYFATGSSGTSYHVVGQKIIDILLQANGMVLKRLPEPVKTVKREFSLHAINNCKLLLENEADFAISRNDISLESVDNINHSRIRSVMPLYPEIFFLIYKNHLNPKSLRDLIVRRKITMGPKGSGTARLTRILLDEFGIDSTEYESDYVDFEDNYLSDDSDICCLMTGFNNPRIIKSLQNRGKIFSFGNYKNLNQGSTIDGFCLKYPLAKPYIIPKRIYRSQPSEPVLTVAIDAVLLTKENIKNEVVYNIVETIVNNKQMIASDQNCQLFGQMNANFNPSKLHFPLHPGARQYLERDKPSFLERYAELMGFIFSLFIAIIGAVTTLTKWNKKRKKNRIDSFYLQVMNIQKQIENLNNKEALVTTRQKLNKLKNEAFQQMIDEKLNADESFRIFINLLDSTKTELESHINRYENI
jgi:TRAP transporter TAXI family solute receptor